MRTLIVILSLVATAIGISTLIPQAHAELNPGDILVIDAGAGTNSRGALFNVDPDTGNRTVISDFGNASQGTLGIEPIDVALRPSGEILVLDSGGGTDNRGLLFSIDPVAGNRTVISDFGNVSQGTLGLSVSGLALDNSGNILVTTSNGGTNSRGLLFSIDPATGSRTVISDFSNMSQGPLGANPADVALDPSGNILVIDFTSGTNFRGLLFSIDPVTGNRTVISDFGNASQGSLGTIPIGVAPGLRETY